MQCPTENLIFRFAAGRLKAREAAALERHFDTCADCRALLAEAARTAPYDEVTPAPRPVQPRGTQLGRYVLLETLGAGSMGAVYAAYDPQLDRQVAIKLLHPGDQSSNRQRRLIREGQAMARLKHANVVSVYDAGTIEGQTFVAMELIAGVNLRRWLTERAARPTEVLEVMAQAGRGLAAAHAAGIVHRDFKPENVLVDSEGGVHITDFGLARLPERVEEPQAERAPPGKRHPAMAVALSPAGGTPAYMPPEQQFKGYADARSDQYAFCVVLHEALFGARPDEEAKGKASAPRLPPGVMKALQRGLSRDPADRFTSMNALLDALGAERDRGSGKQPRRSAGAQ